MNNENIKTKLLAHPCETEDGDYLHKGTEQVPWTCVMCGLQVDPPIIFQMVIK